MRTFYVVCSAVFGLTLAGCDSGKPKKPDPVHNGKPLSQWLKDMEADDPAVRREAALNLGDMGRDGMPAFGPLQVALQDKDKATRYRAALAIAKLAAAAPSSPGPIGTFAGPVLEEAVKEGDDEVRKAAADALKRFPSWSAAERAKNSGPPKDFSRRMEEEKRKEKDKNKNKDNDKEKKDN